MNSITLENVTLDYPVYGQSRSFRRALFAGVSNILPIGGMIKGAEEEKTVYIRALEDISLSVKPGDRIGLIGPNGAGKSTLLRVMAGIYEPTLGTIEIKGSVSSLFSTGLGMDPDDTGYENIINMSNFFGMTPSQAKIKAPSIAEFAELGDFINLPVRTYSTGMQTRLSFAIATTIDPGILLLDEGLATGDAHFTKKAGDRINELMGRSSGLVLAAHSNGIIQDFCTSCIFLEHGRIVAAGDVDHVIKEYSDQVG